jgi:peptidoglycan/LPS O-acetylase OafA/YrhL
VKLMASPTPPLVRSAIRPEVQALRALAVGAVVLHHGWPAVAPAGYMGVDVFFVVSGFLITGMLVREAEAEGRVSLTRFYLRRARRILPAAVAVLVVVSALTIAVVPMEEWRRWFRHIVASALYFENWQLAIDSQIPRRADLESTPVQHFWSLSVEEQFYLVWPLLVILAFAIAMKLGRSGRALTVGILGAVTAASFVHSILLTAADANLAYFGTFARAWEFGAGALLALWLSRRRVAASVPRRWGPQLRAGVSWAGLVAILVPIALFREPDVFPGFAVLAPVLGTVAVIWAGMPEPAWSPARLAAWRPVQWTGDVSYSLYLWHWPIFMFAPYLTGVPSPPWLMALLVVLALAVSAASKRWIEDPFRRARGRVLARPTLVLGGIATAVAVIVGAGVAMPGIAAEERGRACEAPQR